MYVHFTHHDNTHTRICFVVMAPANGYVRTILNPWTDAVSGVSDEFSQPTQTVKLRSTYNSVANVDGNSLVLFRPWGLFGSGWINVATITAGTGVLTAYGGPGNHPDNTQINANYEMYRTISYGIKAYYLGAEQTTQGIVQIVPIMGVDPTLTNLPANIADWGQLPGAQTIACAAMTGPFAGAFHSFDRPRFHPAGDSNGRLFFPTIAVLCVGGANANSLRIEVDCNIEVIPKLTAPFTGNQSSVTPSDPTAMNISRRLDPARIGSVAAVTSVSNLGTRKMGGLGTRKRKRRVTRRVTTGAFKKKTYGVGRRLKIGRKRRMR